METLDRLLLLTLACEQALASEQWSELDSLLHERSVLLRSITSEQRYDPRLAQIQAVETRMMGNLRDWRSAVAQEATRGRDAKRAAVAYRRAG